METTTDNGGLPSQEFLDDAEDIRDLRAAKLEEVDESNLSLDEVKKELGLS